MALAAEDNTPVSHQSHLHTTLFSTFFLFQPRPQLLRSSFLETAGAIRPSSVMASAVVRRTGVVPELGRAYGSSYFLRRLPPLSAFAFSLRDFDAKLPFLSRSWIRLGPDKMSNIQPWSFKPSENVPGQWGNGGPLDDNFENIEVETTNPGTSLLAKLAIALGLAATVTFVSLCFKKPSSGSASGVAYLVDASNASAITFCGFTFKLFNRTVVLPEYPPGNIFAFVRWVYFWLLMAAGCELFISEEVLNIWVGTSVAHLVTLDGTWKSFVGSFSLNAPYVLSTVLWVYCDMIPFYFGKLFRQSRASEAVSTKLGVGKEKLQSITKAVQKYGNLIGFISLGVRNPLSFVAGMLGIAADCFFAGVCCDGLITLPIQLAVGFLLREQPFVAVASEATAVSIDRVSISSGCFNCIVFAPSSQAYNMVLILVYIQVLGQFQGEKYGELISLLPRHHKK